MYGNQINREERERERERERESTNKCKITQQDLYQVQQPVTVITEISGTQVPCALRLELRVHSLCWG